MSDTQGPLVSVRQMPQWQVVIVDAGKETIVGYFNKKEDAEKASHAVRATIRLVGASA